MIHRANRITTNASVMDLLSLRRGLIYRGGTVARRPYWVFEAEDDYFVISPSADNQRSGNFAIVSKAAVDHVYKQFAGQKDVTAAAVVRCARRWKHLADEFSANDFVGHTVLYVLAGVGAAEHRPEGPHDQLHFSIKRLRQDCPLHYWRVTP